MYNISPSYTTKRHTLIQILPVLNMLNVTWNEDHEGLDVFFETLQNSYRSNNYVFFFFFFFGVCIKLILGEEVPEPVYALFPTLRSDLKPHLKESMKFRAIFPQVQGAQ